MHAALKMEEHLEVSFKFQEIKKDFRSQKFFQKFVGVLKLLAV